MGLVAIRYAEEAGELVNDYVYIGVSQDNTKHESSPVTECQGSVTFSRPETSDSRRQREDDEQRMERHEAEEDNREVFMERPATGPLEDDEWRNQGGADGQRSDEGLEGSRSGVILSHPSHQASPG